MTSLALNNFKAALHPSRAYKMDVLEGCAHAVVNGIRSLGYECGLYGDYIHFRLLGIPTLAPKGQRNIKVLVSHPDTAELYRNVFQQNRKRFQLLSERKAILTYVHPDAGEGDKNKCMLYLRAMPRFMPSYERFSVAEVDGLPMAPISMILLDLLETWDSAKGGRIKNRRARRILETTDGLLRKHQGTFELGMGAWRSPGVVNRLAQQFCVKYPAAIDTFNHLGVPTSGDGSERRRMKSKYAKRESVLDRDVGHLGRDTRDVDRPVRRHLEEIDSWINTARTRHEN